MSSSTAVGAIVAILIIGAVASIGYYQFQVAPSQLNTTSTSSVPAVSCPSSQCANVTIPAGANAPPSGYTSGQKTTFGFGPDTVTVVIGVNNTIYWINNDVAVHTATSDNGVSPSFDTGNIAAGATAQVTLTTPGTYTYHCTYHSWMQGKIIVLAGSSSAQTTATST